MSGKGTKGPRPLPPDNQLLSREAFNRLVFQRSGGTCVFCDNVAVDAHHVLDRKLFPDGGYYLGNGAAVCQAHHWACEITELSVRDVRHAAGISRPVLPPGFSPGVVYDKWGNREVSLYGQLMLVEGPLADDEGMRKALRTGRKLQLLCSADNAKTGDEA